MRHIFIKGDTAQQLRAKIEKAPWLQKSYRAMVEYSNDLLDTQDDYLDGPYNGCEARMMGGIIGTLYTAWMITGNAIYLKKAIHLYTIAVSKDFALYYRINNHLSVGDAALSAAACYDLLEDHLPDGTKKHARALMRELASWLHTCNSTWGLPHKGVSSCNHNSVHYAGMGMCGLVLDEQEWIEHAVQREREFLKYAPDETGYITEGVGYANYGLTTAVIFCEAYYRYSGVQLLDLPDTPNQVIAHMLPLPGHLLKLNDHGNGGQMMPQVYLMSRYHNSAGMHLLAQYEEEKKDFFTARSGNMGGGMVFPYLFLFADEKLALKSCTECSVPLTYRFASGRIMARTGWDDPEAVFVSVNCGYSHHFGHNHADKGSFTVYALGEEFLVDVGNSAHDGRGHNIMMINGVTQLRGVSEGDILRFEDDDEKMFVVCDTIKSYEYTPKSLLGISRRNILFVKKPFPMLVIRDDMQVERPIEEQQFFEFMMHTAKGNALEPGEGEIRIIGQNRGNACRLSFVYPQSVDVKVSDEVRQQYSYRRWSCSTDQFEEAIASCSGYNPFLTTVITFARKGEDFPDITAEGDASDLMVRAVSGSAACSIRVTRYNMELQKS